MGAVAVGLAGTATRGTGWDGTAVSERRKTSGFDVEGCKAGPGKDEPAHYVAFRPFATKQLYAVFLFLYFLFSFFTKIYFRFGNLQEYTRPPGSGAAGAFLKKISQRKLRAGPWGPVARQRGGRPWLPGCRATGRNFYNLALFAKEFHICALFVTFCRNRS